MAALPESARAVLESSALAHLVTPEPDGRPQVSIVWVGLDGDEIVMAHRVYLGPDVKFPPIDDPPPGYITHIAVESVGGVRPWAR